ncbi:MAG: hypothetical protein WD208_12280 [Dehalococcoidia bacterium]
MSNSRLDATASGGCFYAVSHFGLDLFGLGQIREFAFGCLVKNHLTVQFYLEYTTATWSDSDSNIRTASRKQLAYHPGSQVVVASRNAVNNLGLDLTLSHGITSRMNYPFHFAVAGES